MITFSVSYSRLEILVLRDGYTGPNMQISTIQVMGVNHRVDKVETDSGYVGNLTFSHDLFTKVRIRSWQFLYLKLFTKFQY